MTSHLGPSHTQNNDKATSKADKSLMQHIDTYEAHGFQIKWVTTDGESAIKAVKQGRCNEYTGAWLTHTTCGISYSSLEK